MINSRNDWFTITANNNSTTYNKKQIAMIVIENK